MREDDDFGDEIAAVEQTGEEEITANKLPWDGSDRDYKYEELLGESAEWNSIQVTSVFSCDSLFNSIEILQWL